MNPKLQNEFKKYSQIYSVEKKLWEDIKLITASQKIQGIFTTALLTEHNNDVILSIFYTWKKEKKVNITFLADLSSAT